MDKVDFKELLWLHFWYPDIFPLFSWGGISTKLAGHSSEKRGLCLMKCSSETLQKFSLMNALVYINYERLGAAFIRGKK